MLISSFKNQGQGFTLIETLVGIMLTAFVSSALLLGITQVKLSLSSIDARNNAFEELKARTEALIAMAAKDINRPGCINNQDITLIASPDPDDNDILAGKFSYCYFKSQNSGDYSEYYNIYTKVEWPEKNRFFFETSPSYKAAEKIEFKVHQLVID